jgi:hypothetical protein
MYACSHANAISTSLSSSHIQTQCFDNTNDDDDDVDSADSFLVALLLLSTTLLSSSVRKFLAMYSQLEIFLL